MTTTLWSHTRRLIAAALIAAGALGVAGASMLAATGFEWSAPVASKCPPEKEPLC